MSTTRRLAWPLRPGAGPAIAELVEEIAADVDAAAPPAGGALLLVEATGGGGELLRLAERLAAHWNAAGRAVLVVDAHPAAPFTGEIFAAGAEGFTELLLYGVSPQALGRAREGAAGTWIPAGAPWSLPLDAPEEPDRSLRRLAAAAERVLILADAGDAEGLLAALRDAAAFRLVLAEEEPVPAAGAEAPAPPAAGGEEAPELSAPHVGMEMPPVSLDGAQTAGDEPDTPRRLPVPDLTEEPPRLRRWLIMAAAALVVIVAAWWLFGRREPAPPAPPAGNAADAPERNLRALPDRADLPWQGAAPADSLAGEAVETPVTAPAAAEAEKTASDTATETAAPPPEAAARETPAPPPAATARETGAPPSAAPPGRASAPRRRYESRATWRAALEHPGAFHVQVESYLDSVLARRAGRERGFERAGVILRRASVRGRDWYRLCVGPFPDLASAAAFRDSLLDTTGEDYCVIGLEPTD